MIRTLRTISFLAVFTILLADTTSAEMSPPPASGGTSTTSVTAAGVLVQDSFVGTAGTLLSAHTPDVNVTGNGWALSNGTPAPTLMAGGVGVSAGSGHLQTTIDSGVADVVMGVDYHVGTGPGMGALAFRMVDANNFQLLVTNGTVIQFYRRQAGAWVLASGVLLPAPLLAGSTHRLEVHTLGSALEGWWDGVRLLQETDTFAQTGTRHGLDWNSAYDATTQYDNFLLRTNSTSSTPAPSAPATPSAPTPSAGATGVAPTSALTWTASGATSYTINVGTTNPPPPVATGLTSASYGPSLTAGTTYYWQVLAINAGGTTTGPIWSFTTATATPPPAPPSGGLVQSAKFVHAGTISLPTFSTDPAGYNYGGIALSYNPANNSLFIGGDQIATKVGELGLPGGTSGSATNLQAPADPYGGKVYGSGDSINPSSSNQRVVGGTLVYNGQLIVTAYDYYDAQGTQVLSHFTRPVTLSQGPVTGPLRAGPLGAGFYSGYMGLIPSAWQAALGGPALTGNADLSIISRTSYGPSISVFDPANINGTAVMLVGYPTAHQTLGGWGAVSPYFGGSDSITGVVFPQNTSSVLFFGRHGTTFCYGPGTSNQSQAGQPADGGVDTYCYDPTSTDKGVHGYPYQASVWAYNANDLAAVKAGSKNPWDVTPYAIWSLPELGNSRIGGAAYDPATNRIFVSQMCTASGCPALIHVYQIQ